MARRAVYIEGRMGCGGSKPNGEAEPTPAELKDGEIYASDVTVGIYVLIEGAPCKVTATAAEGKKVKITGAPTRSRKARTRARGPSARTGRDAAMPGRVLGWFYLH